MHVLCGTTSGACSGIRTSVRATLTDERQDIAYSIDSGLGRLTIDRAPISPRCEVGGGVMASERTESRYVQPTHMSDTFKLSDRTRTLALGMDVVSKQCVLKGPRTRCGWSLTCWTRFGR